jgi:hypothetical protein
VAAVIVLDASILIAYLDTTTGTITLPSRCLNADP